MGHELLQQNYFKAKNKLSIRDHTDQPHSENTQSTTLAVNQQRWRSVSAFWEYTDYLTSLTERKQPR